MMVRLSAYSQQLTRDALVSSLLGLVTQAKRHRTLRAARGYHRIMTSCVCAIRQWSMIFPGELSASPPLLVPLIANATTPSASGCMACTAFNVPPTTTGPYAGVYITVSAGTSNGQWVQETVLQANDKRAGDRFGSRYAASPRRVITWLSSVSFYCCCNCMLMRK